MNCLAYATAGRARIFAGCEIVYFTRTEDANRELPVAMANLMKYMQEQGMEVPATP